MQVVNDMEALRFSHRQPSLSLAVVQARGRAAGASGYPVEDRAVERRVDDVVVFHGGQPLSLCLCKLKARPRGGYGAKSRIVQ